MGPPASPRPPGGGRAPVAPDPIDRVHRPYAPLTRRRRVQLALLAVATAVTLVWLLLDPPGATPRVRPGIAADSPRCGPGAAEGCVGSVMRVLPPAPAPSAAASAASAGR